MNLTSWFLNGGVQRISDGEKDSDKCSKSGLFPPNYNAVFQFDPHALL